MEVSPSYSLVAHAGLAISHPYTVQPFGNRLELYDWLQMSLSKPSFGLHLRFGPL